MFFNRIRTLLHHPILKWHQVFLRIWFLKIRSTKSFSSKKKRRDSWCLLRLKRDVSSVGEEVLPFNLDANGSAEDFFFIIIFIIFIFIFWSTGGIFTITMPEAALLLSVDPSYNNSAEWLVGSLQTMGIPTFRQLFLPGVHSRRYLVHD